MPWPLTPNASWAPEPSAWLNRSARLCAHLQAEGLPVLGTPWQAQPLPTPQWVAINHALAREMGWPQGWHALPAGARGGAALDVLSGNASWAGTAPVATAYSGHQFGVWAGDLGDGRALLLGELNTPLGPLEIQLKGAGPTPYARRADGRASLRSSIREYLCSEAMHALGVPTTRALALVASPLRVVRETVETAAVLTRVASGFWRFGHLEHLAHGPEPGRQAALSALVDAVVMWHFPHLQGAPHKPLALLEEAVARTAGMVAAWQAVGFCHGVMNTDNMSLLGLTVDYGPFAFQEGFDPRLASNLSDDLGRYAWDQQPQMGFWNLRALAQALLPLIPEAHGDPSVVAGVLQAYEQQFPQAMRSRWRAKLGLLARRDDDGQLAADLLALMAAHRVDFSVAFRRLCQWRSALPLAHALNAPVRDLFMDRPAFDAWAQRYNARLQWEGSADEARALHMQRHNPVYVLRQHLAEAAIQQASRGDFSEVHRLQRLLQNPFAAQAGCQAYADAPPDRAQPLTVSCSS